MADFRIALPDDANGLAQRELDWDRETSLWTVSEREYGSARWDMGMAPSAWDLGHILVFFRMTDPVREENLARMTPGECVLTHTAQTGMKDLVAELCQDCGEHWLVYRLEDASWRLYGRTCSFAWHRGRAVSPDEDQLLADLIAGGR